MGVSQWAIEHLWLHGHPFEACGKPGDDVGNVAGVYIAPLFVC